jgi:hypothetical protein
MYVWWNLTGSLKRRKQQDIFVISVSKSGRTWLRVLINKYFSDLYNIPFKIEDLSKYNKSVPKIFYTHELWEHYSHAKFSHKILGKYVLPDKLLLNKKVILMFRDPRDILVSLYFHITKRDKKELHMTLETFMRDKKYGIQRIIQVMNIWRKRLKNHRSCLWLSYESLRHQTNEVFTNVMRFIEDKEVSANLIKQSVEFAEFENMKKMEARGEFKTKKLTPGDPTDSNSFKVREGKIGGYLNHFDSNSLIYLDKHVADLDPFFGYSKR